MILRQKLEIVQRKPKQIQSIPKESARMHCEKRKRVTNNKNKGALSAIDLK